MTSLEKIVGFAKENCTVIDDTIPKAVEEWGSWNGYKVFIPDYGFEEVGEELPEIGLPEFILVKGDVVRLANAEETDKVLFDGECTMPDECE